MNQRSLAISILQKARDTLGERLTQRVVESQQEIADDAEGCSYLSEIETIYEQLGGRLAHVNAMLANLPPSSAPSPADTAANEIIYADLAQAYPTGLDLEAASPLPLLALPAPPGFEQQRQASLLDQDFHDVAVHIQSGDVSVASRMISELFDIKPSQAQRAALAFAQRVARAPDFAVTIIRLANLLDDRDEDAAMALLEDCFDFHPVEALTIVQNLRQRLAAPDVRDRSTD